MMYNICSGTIQFQVHDFRSDVNSNDYNIFHHLWDICKTKKCENFDLENEVKVKK